MAFSLLDLDLQDEVLLELAEITEKHRFDHPSVPLPQLGNFAELILEKFGEKNGTPRLVDANGYEESFHDMLERVKGDLDNANLVTDFFFVKKLRNAADHTRTRYLLTPDNAQEAFNACYRIGRWFVSLRDGAPARDTGIGEAIQTIIRDYKQGRRGDAKHPIEGAAERVLSTYVEPPKPKKPPRTRKPMRGPSTKLFKRTVVVALLIGGYVVLQQPEVRREFNNFISPPLSPEEPHLGT